MATDMHLHVSDGLSGEDFRCKFSNHMGSIYFNPHFRCAQGNIPGKECPHRSRTAETPHILVGEVPWPHASFLPPTDEEQAHIPDPMGAIIDVFPPDGVLPVPITTQAIQAVEDALNSISQTDELAYGPFEPSQRTHEITAFLKNHQGKGAYPLFY